MSSEAYNSMPVPTNLNLLKNHEVWFYFLGISHVRFPSFPLFSTIFVFVFLPTRHVAINSSYGGDSKVWEGSHKF